MNCRILMGSVLAAGPFDPLRQGFEIPIANCIVIVARHHPA
jgi:hypothetical protein